MSWAPDRGEWNLTVYDPVMLEIDQLNRIIEAERVKTHTLIELLDNMGVRVWFDGNGEITIINEALEPPSPIVLGDGYLGLGASGT